MKTSQRKKKRKEEEEGKCLLLQCVYEKCKI